MIRKVLKFKFEKEDGTLTLPPLFYYDDHNPVVHFDRQGQGACVWVETSDLPGSQLTLEFKVFGTGQDINDPKWRHVRSMSDGPYIWHLYMRYGKS